MADWLSSMEQTYEYYIVDPGTWKDKQRINNIKTSTINRDSEVETLGSATIDITESVGECYIRIYLITIQNGVREKHALGTVLVQTPSSSFNGKVREVSMDAYTPLLELKEKQLPIGYFVEKGANILEKAHLLLTTNVTDGSGQLKNLRAPVVETVCDTKLVDDFVADPSDTILAFINDLIKNAKYKLNLDEIGRVLFEPDQDIDSLQPVWTYNDDNSSILYPDLTMDHDIYGIPNVVEVIYSNGNNQYYHREVNDDPNSPTSIVNRGREIVYRVTDPAFTGIPSKKEVEEYAKKILSESSTIEYTITYTHGYCPVRLGDCVRLNYTRAGLTNIKAKVISQSIKCEPGCPVTEKAVFTKKLWR